MDDNDDNTDHTPSRVILALNLQSPKIFEVVEQVQGRVKAVGVELDLLVRSGLLTTVAATATSSVPVLQLAALYDIPRTIAAAAKILSEESWGFCLHAGAPGDSIRAAVAHKGSAKVFIRQIRPLAAQFIPRDWPVDGVICHSEEVSFFRDYWPNKIIIARLETVQEAKNVIRAGADYVLLDSLPRVERLAGLLKRVNEEIAAAG